MEHTIEKTLQEIHATLKIASQDIQDKQFQSMLVQFLTGDEKVLEIGSVPCFQGSMFCPSDRGSQQGTSKRASHSLIIQAILSKKGNTQFVVLESNPEIASPLRKDRDLHHFHFPIETSSLSTKQIIQQKWETIVSDGVFPEYCSIPTITLNELYHKYHIVFDTLILDCNDAFYHILTDLPAIIDPVHLILMKNDYYHDAHKKYIDDTLTAKGFQCVYTQCAEWKCHSMNFFEVWKK